MSDIFNLNNINQLIEEEHPTRILVIDTNVVMNDPDHHNWRVEGAGKTLFILPDLMVQELEFIRKKPDSRQKVESRDKADKAIKSLASLFKQGNITKGIPLDAGWVIGIPSPDQNELNEELEQLKDLEIAFGRSDIKLLLLTKECHQQFSNIPVSLITGEWNLFNVIQMQGVPCHLCYGFPITGLKEAAASIQPVDWDRELVEIQEKSNKSTILIEATLTSQRIAPTWLGPNRIIISEGHGVMHDGNTNRTFLWTIPFYPKGINSCQSEEQPSNSLLIYPVFLDFLGEGDFDQDLFDAIGDRLLECKNYNPNEEIPCLQSPEYIMQSLLISEYSREEEPQEKADILNQMVKELGADYIEDSWTDWMIDRDSDEEFDIFFRFRKAISRHWAIGQTYRFRIVK